MIYCKIDAYEDYYTIITGDKSDFILLDLYNCLMKGCDRWYATIINKVYNKPPLGFAETHSDIVLSYND